MWTEASSRGSQAGPRKLLRTGDRYVMDCTRARRMRRCYLTVNNESSSRQMHLRQTDALCKPIERVPSLGFAAELGAVAIDVGRLIGERRLSLGSSQSTIWDARDLELCETVRARS